jgi:hypothetical protein
VTGDHDSAACALLIIVPRTAGSGGLHLLSFVLPAGLADGLALKELRYVDLSTIRPWPWEAKWFPRALRVGLWLS